MKSYISLADYRSIVEKWGSCHVELYDYRVAEILLFKDLLVEHIEWTGEIFNNKKIYYCHIRSPKLKKDCHGIQNMVINGTEYYFKPDSDC